MTNSKTRLAVLLLCTFCFIPSSYGQITPSADASTSSLTPSHNYGSNGDLYVRSTTQVTYIQFDLSTIPSGYTGSNIAKASLKLYIDSVAAGGTFNVDYVTSPWSEKTITFDNSPTLGAFIAASENIAAANVKDYVVIDITPAVQAWLNGSESNNGIALVGNGTFNAGFESKENTVTSHPPELDIVFAEGGSAITGITTANGSGLSGGGTSGNLNLSLISTCSIGQVLAWNGAGGGWVCSTVSGGGGGITGSGTVNSLALFNGVTSISSSNLFQSTTNTNIGIGTATPQATLDVNGNINLPNTTSSTVGVISMGGTPFLSNYGPSDQAGQTNTFVGGRAGNMTMTGGLNSVFGNSAFTLNASGNANTAIGVQALPSSTTGTGNTGIGAGTLFANQTGSYNTALGFFAGDGSATTLNNTTAVGAYADVTQSNSLVLGSIVNINGCDPSGTPSCQSTNVGIGTTAPAYPLDVNGIIRSSSGGFMFPDGTVQTTKASSGGGSGTVTSVGSGMGLTGGPITTSGTLAIDTSVVPVLSASNTFGGAITAPSFIGNGAGLTNVNAAALGGFSPSTFATIGANTFTGNQTIMGGNVGIGTTTPQAALDVNGSINLPNTTSSTVGVLSMGGQPFLSNYSPGPYHFPNTFVGALAGNMTTTGGYNSAFGYSALGQNSGTGNDAFGDSALQQNSGTSNDAFGVGALFRNGSGNDNDAFGSAALGSSTAGSNNSAFGANSLFGLQTGSSNIAIGSAAGLNLNAGESNDIYVGNKGVAGESNTIRIGDPTVQNVTFLVGNVGVDVPAGSVPAFPLDVHGNTSITGNLTVTGTVTCGSGCSGGGGGGGGSGTVTSVAAGNGLLASPSPITTSGTLSINTAVVPQLSAANTFTGTQTISSGSLNLTGTPGSISATGEISTNGLIFAGSMSTFGAMNAGSYALGGTTVLAHAPSTGGSLLLGENTGNSTLLSSLDISSTTAIGDNILRFYTGGNYNTALGNSALYEATSGSNNTGAGYEALFHNTSGSNNTAMGYNAGNPTGFQNTTGSNDTFVGANSGVGNQLALNYATAVGSGALVGQNNAMVLGGPAGSAAAVNVGIGTATPQATLDVEGTAPTVNFGSPSNQATLTVNGSLNVTGTVTCGSGCGGGGGGGITNVIAGTDLTGGGTGPTVTLNLNTSATDLRYSQLGAANTFLGTQTINTSAGNGISATSSSGTGVYGTGTATGVTGSSSSSIGTGVYGTASGSGIGVTGTSPVQGVFGLASATSGTASGVLGQSNSSGGTGVTGLGYTGVNGMGAGSGVTGTSTSATGSGVVGIENSGGGYAGYFQGDVAVTGNVSSGGYATITGNATIGGTAAIAGSATVAGTLAVGGDTPMSHSPRMTFSGIVASFATSPQSAGFFIPDQPIVITRLTVAVGTGQTPYGVCEFDQNMTIFVTGNQVARLAIPNPGFVDSGALNIPVPSGSLIYIYGNSASSNFPGCQSGNNITATVEYAMQ